MRNIHIKIKSPHSKDAKMFKNNALMFSSIIKHFQVILPLVEYEREPSNLYFLVLQYCKYECKLKNLIALNSQNILFNLVQSQDLWISSQSALYWYLH